MTSSRRDFLRALAAGTGAIIVPKLIGRIFRPPPSTGLLWGIDWSSSESISQLVYHQGQYNAIWRTVPIEKDVISPVRLTEASLRAVERDILYNKGKAAWVWNGEPYIPAGPPTRGTLLPRLDRWLARG